MVRVIAEVMFSPLGTPTPSVGDYVTAALAVLEEHPEVEYQLHPMGTVLEGERGCDSCSGGHERGRVRGGRATGGHRTEDRRTPGQG